MTEEVSCVKVGHISPRNVDHRMRCTLERASLIFISRVRQQWGRRFTKVLHPFNHPLNVTWLITDTTVTAGERRVEIERSLMNRSIFSSLLRARSCKCSSLHLCLMNFSMHVVREEVKPFSVAASFEPLLVTVNIVACESCH